MFDFIRKHTKITMWLLFLLIVPSFILFGMDGYNKSQDKSPVVAKVAGCSSCTTMTLTGNPVPTKCECGS